MLYSMLYLILKSDGQLVSNRLLLKDAEAWVPDCFGRIVDAHDSARAKGLFRYTVLACQQPPAGKQFMA